MMAFPVLDDKAEEAYHRLQRRTKRAVDAEGRAGRLGDEREVGDGRALLGPLPRCDIEVEVGRISEDRRMLRIAFLRWARTLCCCREPLRSPLSLLLLRWWCMGMESRGVLASQPRVGPILRVELRELRAAGFSSN